MKAPRRWLYIAAIFLGVGAALACSEESLRLWWPQENKNLLELRPEGFVFNRRDFSGLFSPEPYASVTEARRTLQNVSKQHLFATEPGSYNNSHPGYVQTNRSGELDDKDHQTRKAPNTFRLLLLGNCFTSSWRTPLEKSYPKLLEREMKGLEVINCSFPGSTLPEELAVYEKHCSRYEADLVVFLLPISRRFFTGASWTLLGEDARLVGILEGALGSGAKEFLDLDEDGVLRVTKAALESGWDRRFQQCFEARLPFYHSSHLIRLIENRWLAYPRCFSGRPNSDEFEASLYGERDRRNFRQISAKVLLAKLAHLRRAVESRNAKFAVALVPGPSADELYDGMPYSKLRSDLKQRLANEGYAFVDLEEMDRSHEWPRSVEMSDELQERRHLWIAGVIKDVIRKFKGWGQ